MNEPRLMVFAKAPEPGRVKTRLALPPEHAARLHAAFLHDVVERHTRPGRRLTVWRAGDLEHPIWAALNARLDVQPSGDLGARMSAAFQTELAGGGPVVILGTDSPTLPPALVDAAFAALEAVDVVVGPACDGGYYLLGARGGVPPVFDGPGWGGPGVLAHTLDSLEAAAIPYRLLDFWYDVDRPEDLALMRAHVPALAASGEVPPRFTLRALQELGL